MQSRHRATCLLKIYRRSVFGPRPWAQLSALLALVTSPSSAWAAPTYDPSGAVLVGQAGRQWSADLAASQLSAWIGGGVIVALGALVAFGVLRLLRDLQPRAQLAIALGVGLLTARLMVSAFLSPIRDGDELIDFAQVALSPFIGLKPVELIFPTGWTLLSGAVHALWLQIHVSGETALDLANATLESLRGGFVLTRWISSLSCGLLALAMARRATLAGGVSGGLLAAGIWLTSLPTTYLATAAGPHAMATSLTWLGVLLATAGQTGVTRALMVGLLWGAAVGTQPLAAVVIASCGAWLGLSWLKAGRWRALAALCGAAAVGWALTNPWVWQQWPVYVENFRYRFAELGAQEAVADHSSGQYTRWLWRHPVVVGGLSAWGVFTLASGRLRARRLVVAPVVGLVTAAVLASLSTRFDRYLIWALPGVALAAGSALAELVRRTQSTRLDALLAGAVVCWCALFGDLRLESPTCPGGVTAYAPLEAVARQRHDGPITFVFQAPQLERAARAGLISRALEKAFEEAVAARVGGNARLWLGAYDQRRALPAAVLSAPGGGSAAAGNRRPQEIWELRWRRDTASDAPIRVQSAPVMRAVNGEARCGMLLRGAPLRVASP